MRRADRLFQIVQLLRGGRLVTASALAEKLEVSPRTIYRDIADLIGSGVPIDGAAGLGYVMRGGYDIPPLMFTEAEITALVAGARMVRAWGGLEMAAAADEALLKIDAVLSPEIRARADAVGIHAVAVEDMPAPLKRRLDALDRATRDRTRLHLTYRTEAGEITRRHVHPLGLFYWGRTWTLVGWCELREDFRMFRLDRITDHAADGTFPDRRDRSLRCWYERERRAGCIPDNAQ